MCHHKEISISDPLSFSMTCVEFYKILVAPKHTYFEIELKDILRPGANPPIHCNQHFTVKNYFPSNITFLKLKNLQW